MSKKYYCYVDETGQHTMGKIFIVSIVVSTSHEKLDKDLIKIENITGKNKVKWIKTHKDRRINYLEQVFGLKEIKGNIYFSSFSHSKEYKALTVLSVVKAIKDKKYSNNKAVISIDGLNKNEVKWFSKEIRKQGVKTNKVRGLKDENSAIIRLADSICGFVFDAKAGKKGIHKLLLREIKQGNIKEV